MYAERHIIIEIQQLQEDNYDWWSSYLDGQFDLISKHLFIAIQKMKAVPIKKLIQ